MVDAGVKKKFQSTLLREERRVFILFPFPYLLFQSTLLREERPHLPQSN